MVIHADETNSQADSRHHDSHVLKAPILETSLEKDILAATRCLYYLPIRCVLVVRHKVDHQVDYTDNDGEPHYNHEAEPFPCGRLQCAEVLEAIA